MSGLRDQPSTNRARSSIRARAAYRLPTGEDPRRAPSRGRPGAVRFLAFALGPALIVLILLVTVGRPLLTSAVINWAGTNPQALSIPFVSDLVRENLGSKLTTAPSNDASEVEFFVQPGDTAAAIAQHLADQGFVVDARAFVFVSYERKIADTWLAGRYVLRRNMTPDELVQTIQAGPPADPVVSIGLREGLRLEQITALLEKLHEQQGLEMDPQAFYDIVKHPPADLLAQYPWLHLPSGASLEGFLGAATYRVKPDVAPEALVKMLIDHFYESVGADRLSVPKARGLTFYQVLTLASIIEQEAVVDDERPLIAGVYQNRLTKKMTFDADPTVIYANDTTQLAALPFEKWVQFSFWNLPQGTSMQNVQVDPSLAGYQTYRHAGLPPGPICTPTAASIDAALEPDTKAGYLYFVARNDGSHTHAFAKTYAEHLANLRKYGYIK